MDRKNLSDNVRMALATINQEPTIGIPSWLIHPMEHAVIEALAGTGPGSYVKDPEPVYLKMRKNIGTCFLDQFIPKNPLTMDSHGYEVGTQKSATTGAEKIIADGMEIDSPEAVAEHIKTLFEGLNYYKQHGRK